MSFNLKKDLKFMLKNAGAFDVGIADPNRGFEQAIKERHPLELWNKCKSVIVFVIARPPKSNNTYFGTYSPVNKRMYNPKKGGTGPVPQYFQSNDYGMTRLINMMSNNIKLKVMEFLKKRDYDFSFKKSQQKLCAYEAGLGVYGRSGVIIHPVLGNRIKISTILTDAEIPPDSPLIDFNPCKDCYTCVEMCPANAYDKNKEYPESWSRNICTNKRAKFIENNLYCHNCFASCPAGKIKDEKLLNKEKAKSIYSKK